MNTSATFYSPSLDIDQKDQKPPQKSSKSWSSFVHNPRKFLAAIMGVALVSVLGIGLVAGMQSMNQSTDRRSQAAGEGDLYFTAATKTVVPGTVAQQGIKINAGRTLGAITFGVGYDSTKISNVDFVTPHYEKVVQANGPGKTLIFLYARADQMGWGGGTPGDLGQLVFTPTAQMGAETTISFLSLANAGTGGNSAVFTGSPGAGGHLTLTPANTLSVVTGPTNTPLPGAPTPMPPMFSGVPNPGVLSYCTTTTANCTDAQWQVASVANGESTVPTNTKQLRYRIDNISNPAGWTTNMRAEVTGRDVVVQTGLGVTASNLIAANWPVVVGTNYVKEESGNQFICTIRPRPLNGDGRYKEYVRRPVGSTDPGVFATDDGRCANNTRIMVNLAGAPTATPTRTPTPTTTPTNTPPAQNTSADLVPTFFETPASVSVNQQFPVNIRIKNEGGTQTPNPVTVIFYRNDAEIYRTTRTASLWPNESYSVTRNEVASVAGTLEYRVRVIMSGEVLTGNNIATRSVVVTAAGAAPTATPTNTPPAGTALQCRPTAPRLDPPMAVVPAVVSIDSGRQFRLQWNNVLKDASSGAGKYGIYLINDGTQAAPASGGQYYLFDVIDGNTTFATSTNGALQDQSINLNPGTGSTMSYLWTVPTDNRTDKLGQVIKNRPFYRFLVYAKLSNTTNSCASQATIGRWARP